MAKKRKTQVDKFFEYFNERYESLTFDDVSLKSGYSEVVPRDVCLETLLTPDIGLKIPLTSADMDTVTESRMAIALAKLGGLGFLWKHPDISEQEHWVQSVKYNLNAFIDKPITILETASLEDVRQTLEKYDGRFSTLPVLGDDGKVIGLVTKDRMQFAEPGERVSDFMIKTPYTTSRMVDVRGAYKLMRRERVAKLIIVSKSGKLRGMYCYKDVREIVEGQTPEFNRDANGKLRVGANVGIHDYERVSRLLAAGCDVLLVGTAHGDSKNVLETVREIRRNFKSHNFGLVAGNVVTYDSAVNLFKAGADCAKAGLGGGSICTTRIVSGIGVPQLSASYDVAKAARRFGKTSIADGAIRHSGDLMKALATGANCVMVGNLVAGTDETPGKVKLDSRGLGYKIYRGMGSLDAMRENQTAERYGKEGLPPEKRVAEGVPAAVPYKGLLAVVVHNLMWGLRAGMGYMGAKTIYEIPEKAMFIKINVAGQTEGHPHDVKVIEEESKK